MPDVNLSEFQIKTAKAYTKLAVLATVFIVFGAWFYHVVENLKWLDSFYFTVITLSTVGYGDITPKTNSGKLFTIFYVFIGIVLFLALARIILTSFAIRLQKRNDKSNK